MKIFLDTADVDLIEQYYGTGLIDGVTTNPTLIKKSGYDPEEVYRKIALIGVDDISMEIVTDDSYEFLRKVVDSKRNLVKSQQSKFLVHPKA